MDCICNYRKITTNMIKNLGYMSLAKTAELVKLNAASQPRMQRFI